MKKSMQTGGKGKYPFKMSRLYVNAATTILAVFLAVVMLTELPLLLLFLLLTISICAALFVLRIRPVFRIRKPGDQQESTMQPLGRRGLYVLLIVVIATALPFLLFFSAGSLPPYIWFAVLASVASGMGISEILYYVYCRRTV